MKIIHIFKDYYPVIGGIENHIKILAEFQAKNGFDVTVLTTSPYKKSSLETINSVRVIKAARLMTASSTPVSLAILRWVRKLRADITHLHFPYPVGEFAHLFWGHSRHTIVTYHSDIIKQKFLLKLYKPFLLRILQRAHCIITTSHEFMNSSPVLNRYSHKCKIIPYGVDLRKFNNPDELISNRIRKKFDDSPIVMFVGRLRYFKGVEYLIDAMESVSAKLLIIGDGSDKNRLKQRVNRQGLQGKIYFLGEISNENMPEYYKICDVLVLPSSHRSESFGIVLIEAMASGKPVVSTQLGTGTSFINVHGKTGFVVPPRNTRLLSEAINKLLTDDSLRKKFAMNARKRVEKFSMETMNEKIINIYRSVHAL